VRVLIATKPVDFGRGADSLAALARKELQRDPFSGTIVDDAAACQARSQHGPKGKTRLPRHARSGYVVQDPRGARGQAAQGAYYLERRNRLGPGSFHRE
jgi:hypothetical protein